MNDTSTEKPYYRWSEIEVQEVRGVSRLISCKNEQPLKILNPRTHNKTCHVVLSSYGGGMVSGDQIKILLRCSVNTRLFLSSQANTKIFQHINNANAEQIIDAHLDENALAVIFPDPVVLQKSSRFRQSQHYHLKKDSLLLLVDWFHSGRMDSGEKFVFENYYSEVRISIEGKLKMIDKFDFDPLEQAPASPANFGVFQTMMSVYLVGSPEDERVKVISELFIKLKDPACEGMPQDKSKEACLCTVTQPRKDVLVLRAIATGRKAVQPIYSKISAVLKDARLLGLNPDSRKF